MRILPLIFVVFACVVPARGGTGVAAKIRVAAASDLRFAFDRLIDEYRKTHPITELSVVYGSSGTFALQIEQGAPFDLFFSADAELPARLAKAGRVSGEPFPYAVGRVVLWVPKESKLDLGLGLRVLDQEQVHRIAIANARHAPYGRAAEQALRSAGLLEKLRAKLIVGENVAQAAQFVETGGAAAGLIARSLAVNPPLKDHGRFIELDVGPSAGIRQSAVILERAVNQEACKSFRDFVCGTRGQALLKESGLDAAN